MKCIKLFPVALSIISVLSASEASANSTIDALLSDGAELRITKPDGRQLTLTISADHRYSADFGATGTWYLDGNQFCMTRDTDSNADGRGGQTSCGTLPDGKSVGDRWILTSDDGAETVFTIVQNE